MSVEKVAGSNGFMYHMDNVWGLNGVYPAYSWWLKVTNRAASSMVTLFRIPGSANPYALTAVLDETILTITWKTLECRTVSLTAEVLGEQWHHIYFTTDVDTDTYQFMRYIYLDGELVDSYGMEDSPSGHTDGFTGSPEYFIVESPDMTIRMADLCFWKTQLTAEELTALQTEAACNVAPEKLVLNWQFYNGGYDLVRGYRMGLQGTTISTNNPDITGLIATDAPSPSDIPPPFVELITFPYYMVKNITQRKQYLKWLPTLKYKRTGNSLQYNVLYYGRNLKAGEAVVVPADIYDVITHVPEYSVPFYQDLNSKVTARRVR